MKKALRSIISRGEFDDSGKDLRDIVSDEEHAGGWVDRGSYKYCRLDSSDPFSARIYFWPASGRVLHCAYEYELPGVQSELAWALVRSWRNENSGAKRWKTYGFGPFGRRYSLPELFLCRPKIAMQDVVFGAPGDDFDLYELAEVFDKICAIRIPKRFSAGARVVTSYSSGKGEHIGFDVTEEPVWKARASRIHISRHIDLRRAAFDWRGRHSFSSPVSSLMAVLADDPSAIWDRQQCETFFNNSRNFHELMEGFDREEAERTGRRIHGMIDEHY